MALETSSNQGFLWQSHFSRTSWYLFWISVVLSAIVCTSVSSTRYQWPSPLRGMARPSPPLTTWSTLWRPSMIRTGRKCRPELSAEPRDWTGSWPRDLAMRMLQLQDSETSLSQLPNRNCWESLTTIQSATTFDRCLVENKGQQVTLFGDFACLPLVTV